MADMPIPDIPTLERGHVRVRPWRAGDQAAVIEASKDPFIPMISSVPSNADETDAAEFIDRQLARPCTDWGHARAVADIETDSARGHLYVSLIKIAVGRAEMGYWTLASQRGAGLASNALDLAAEWVLGTLPIHRITLYIEPWNEGSIRTAERAGFTHDALLPSWEAYGGGAPRDMYAYRRLRD